MEIISNWTENRFGYFQVYDDNHASLFLSSWNFVELRKKTEKAPDTTGLLILELAPELLVKKSIHVPLMLDIEFCQSGFLLQNC